MYPIVSISGFPGSGKSTLCRNIRDKLNFHYIDYDCFGILTNTSPEALKLWIKAGMPFETLFSNEFSERVVEASQISPVVIETPLGPLHGDDGIKVALSIWLEVELDVALLRALTKALNEDWTSIAELQNWLSGYHTAYETFVRNSLLRQQQVVATRCDIDIDGDKPMDDVINESVAHIVNSLDLINVFAKR